jgi:hypothetical protein
VSEGNGGGLETAAALFCCCLPWHGLHGSRQRSIQVTLHTSPPQTISYAPCSRSVWSFAHGQPAPWKPNTCHPLNFVSAQMLLRNASHGAVPHDSASHGKEQEISLVLHHLRFCCHAKQGKHEQLARACIIVHISSTRKRFPRTRYKHTRDE